jgi:RNA polymerase sigma-70 factor (ECF subfamily)
VDELAAIELLTKSKIRGLRAEEHMSIAAVPRTSETLAPEFEEIFREHCRLVYRTAFTVTGNHQDAEDVLQNIFLKLLEREFQPDLETNPRAYLYRAAVNMSLKTIRSRKRRRLVDGVECLETPALITETGPYPEHDEIRRHLRDAIAQLKPRAVEILVLRYEHNYSDADIAKMLGKSRGTVAVTLYRARARLKKLLRASLGGHNEP